MYLRPVPLSANEVEQYYEGFSNDTLWPIYHDVIVQPSFHRDWWRTYVAVNQRFADAVAEVAAEGATVWVQDYQLQLVPRMVREQRPDLRIGWFNHIPFPAVELFAQIPWRRAILEASSAPTSSGSSARPTPRTSSAPAGGCSRSPPGR